MEITRKIFEIGSASNVKFGTSGVRGRVEDMSDEVCYGYTLGFLQYLTKQNLLNKGSEVGLAGDLRKSTPRIMAAICAAIEDMGCHPTNYGNIPTPALANYGIRHKVPTIMVTGSHIPDDRNGIKFYTPSGEILKSDEQGILKEVISYPSNRFTPTGNIAHQYTLPEVHAVAYQLYVQRYLDFFPTQCFQGRKIGLYEHSSVAREVLKEILTELGANVTPLNRSDLFVPVDTEAIREEDQILAKQWASQHHFDCIISTDGDGDRPLLSDEKGEWLRGDVAGLLCAQYLKADVVVTPVSSNSSVDLCDSFAQVYRTRIGSPYVIQAMNNHTSSSDSVVGYEANGGFLIGQDIHEEGRTLEALPTRDSAIVPLAILALATQKSCTLSQLLSSLPQRFTASDRLKEFPGEISQPILNKMSSGNLEQDKLEAQKLFGHVAQSPVSIDTTDGVRITLENKDVIHLRQSGNAPELRCYNEADSPERSQKLNKECLDILKTWMA